MRAILAMGLGVLILTGACAPTRQEMVLPPDSEREALCDPVDPCRPGACGMGSNGCGGTQYCGPCAVCPETDPHPGLAYLEGTVLDADTGEAIAGGPTTVAINGEHPQGLPGRSFLRVVPTGEAHVRVESAGFDPLEETLTLQPCWLQRTFLLHRSPVPHEGPPVSCNYNHLTCRRSGGGCAPGMVHAVRNGCFAECVWIGRCQCAGDDDCPGTRCGADGRCVGP